MIDNYKDFSEDSESSDSDSECDSSFNEDVIKALKNQRSRKLTIRKSPVIRDKPISGLITT